MIFFNVQFFHVSNNSLKLMYVGSWLNFLFFMTSIYTWDPLSRSYDSPKSKVKRILMARHYVSKKLEIPIALEIHFLIHRTSWKHKWRGYSWLDNMLQNFKIFLLHLRFYVKLILNDGIKSVLVGISSFLSGQQVHATSKFMA